MAGALGVRLGGPATYGGVPGSKPSWATPARPIDRATVRRAVGLMWVAAALAVALAWGSGSGSLARLDRTRQAVLTV